MERKEMSKTKGKSKPETEIIEDKSSLGGDLGDCLEKWRRRGASRAELVGMLDLTGDLLRHEALLAVRAAADKEGKETVASRDPVCEIAVRMLEAINITLGLMHRCNQTHDEGGLRDYMDVHDTGLSAPISAVLEGIVEEAREMGLGVQEDEPEGGGASNE